MDFKVDIICNETSQVVEMDMLLASAHVYIAERKGVIVFDEIGTDHDGNSVRDLYVRFPDVVEEERAYAKRMKKASEHWCSTSKVMAGV